MDCEGDKVLVSRDFKRWYTMINKVIVFKLLTSKNVFNFGQS